MAKNAKNIRIAPIGGLGNRMFQYLLAHVLQLHVPEAAIGGLDIPQFGIATGAAAAEPPDAHRIEILRHVFPFAETVAALRTFDPVVVDIRWVCMRMEYFQDHLDLARRLFPIDPALRSGFDERHLVITFAHWMSPCAGTATTTCCRSPGIAT